MNTHERVAQGAKAAKAMLGLSAEAKNTALAAIESRLLARRADIAAANRADIAAATAANIPGPLLKRLYFEGTKFDEAIAGIQALRSIPDPSGRVLEARELDQGLVLRRLSCPIGLVAMIFESRPDALVQMSCLAAKSGNAIVLKGGSEAKESNRLLSRIILEAGVSAGLPQDWLVALETREEIGELLSLDRYVDLVIPRGSKEFVARIQATSKIPVLGHSDGVCHVYAHKDADPAMAMRIVLDSKTNYPAACNAAEVLLVHEDFAQAHLPDLAAALLSAGVALDACPRTLALLKAPSPAITAKTDNDWSVEYLDMRMAVKIVDSLEEAIDHVNRFGSGHTDAIICKSPEAAAFFQLRVDSASVYHNASTRFADGYRYGLGAEVGISTGKLHARGPMGLEGLLTYKWILEGNGQIVADYSTGGRSFTHKELPHD